MSRNELAVGIDLGGTKIEGVLLDEDGVVQDRLRIATEREGGYEHILDRVCGLVGRLAGATDAPIGIGTPGSVTRAGRMKNSNTTCLNGRPLPEDLAARLARPVRIENDANCFALAEALAGAGRGARFVFGAILGTGVGGGLVYRGELLCGPQHVAGEWGHHCLDPEGPACYCGQRGCAETFLSGPALTAAYRRAGGEEVGSAEVAARARAGEAIAARVFADYLRRFGRGVANVIDILDPDVIVLGGGMSNLEELYTEGRAAVAACVFNEELETAIIRNELGDSAGVIGAALLARQSLAGGES